MRQQDKIVIVTRTTRLEQLIARFNTWRQAKFYLEHMQLDPAGYEAEHETYVAALGRVRHDLNNLDRPVHPLERTYLPNYLFGPQDVVVTVGPDGLVVNAAKYLRGQPLVAVNPDPLHIDGILLPFSAGEAIAAVAAAASGSAPLMPITMAETSFNDGQQLLAFNDFLIGCRTHVSARYRLTWRGRSEVQSSSGILVSTGAGSTGWLSSTRNMAVALSRLITNDNKIDLPAWRMPWNDPRLAFVVREPFASKASGIELAAGLLEPGETLTIESQMAEGGVVFSDGIETDALSFNAGAVATVRTADRQTQLVVKP